ncbi:DUF6869 domain-containing protein [Aliiroseovarius subalbicans]|uniref:DUF6869 domain-containing protein n=1 Tax=Aliiroseovarius subalbicans TaxID=2925840 RepID=UPI001F57237D|nr:hypothetical protein [Aliiroseovarius subalbicans]MCI2398043.1 hypothetical protein [Aliiroseovarius subalbicans]
MSTPEPRCFDCAGRKQRLCAPDGQFDAAYLARSYLDMITLRETDDAAADALFWAFNCLSDMLIDDPERAFHVTLLMINTLETPLQASVVASGPMEDLIADTGAEFIDRIEVLARRSPRFRYVLSGVWPQGQEGRPIWNRVESARAPGPDMDSSATLPAADGASFRD